MSLLDDLKKQAEEKAKSDQGQGKSGGNQHEKNWHVIAPKLHIIFNYLKELSRNLNIVTSDSPTNYQLTKTIVFKNLKKKDFRIVKDNNSEMKSFSFRYDLIGDRNIPVVVNNLPEAEKLKSLLNQRMIKFTDKVENKNRIIISVVPKICVRFTYSADLANGMILLNISDFNSAWDQTIRLSPESVTENLMEETAKYILDQPSKLMEMTGNIISDDMREKLRERLKQDGKIKPEAEKEDKLESTAHRVLGMFKK